jgi:hypothetical protein
MNNRFDGSCRQASDRQKQLAPNLVKIKWLTPNEIFSLNKTFVIQNDFQYSINTGQAKPHLN